MNKRSLSVLLFAALPVALIGQAMQLSIEEAVAAALERNLSVQISRIDPQLARERERAARGQFDPVLESEYNYSRDELSAYTFDDESASMALSAGTTFPWGTQVEALVSASDRTTPFDPFRGTTGDFITSFAGIVVTQPVLRNFGMAGTWTPVLIARESVTTSWEGFRAQVMDIVEATVTAYQNVYLAQENLRITKRNRDLALKLLKDNQKRVETGAMAPLDIVQAESEAALREVSVISAGAFLTQATNALKALIWDQPGTVLKLQLEIEPPREPKRFLPDQARDFQLALRQLPEYLAATSGLSIRELEVNQLRRNALPQLDLVGSYGSSGLSAGSSSSLGDSFDDAFANGDSSYSIGAVFSLPLPNRSRSAEKAQAYLRRNQAELELRQLEQEIQLTLDNASTQLTADWERIRAARTARELAEKSLEAEEKKLQAGTSSTFVVLRLQGDLANAEIREINALADYAVSLARYHRARGSILENHGIILAK